MKVSFVAGLAAAAEDVQKRAGATTASEVLSPAQFAGSGYAYGAQLERQGYRMLGDLMKMGIPYQGLGMIAKRSLIDRTPEIPERTLRAMVETIAYVNNPANKTAVVKTLTRELRLSKVEDAQAGYEVMRTLYDKKIYPNLEGLRNVVRLLGKSSEPIRKLKVEDIVDDRVVRKLEKEGLF